MITIFTTGGSIDKYYSPVESTFIVGPPCADAILGEAAAGCAHRVAPLFRKDSLDITDEDRAAIVAAVEADDAPMVVVTHGTDTMARTAEALAAVRGRTIVVTGALRPAVCADSDARFNLGFALAAVQTLPPGAYVAMNGRVFAAGTVRKDAGTMRFEVDN